VNVLYVYAPLESCNLTVTVYIYVSELALGDITKELSVKTINVYATPKLDVTTTESELKS
jgi:hypothetical protein